MVKVGVIGTGYWGRHHLRIFSKLKCELVGIADVDPRRIDLAKEYHTGFYTDYKKLLKKVDAVSIVTPPSIHYKIAKKAISSGKHVLLEKPFVFKVKEAQILAGLAKSQNLVVMSGHTYLYHPVVLEMKKLIDDGELGKLYYLFLQWLNLGIIRSDVDSLWNFGPHPFSILNYLLGEMPTKISVVGQSFVQKGIHDVVFANLHYKDSKIAQVNLSWLHPQKIREVTIVGSKRLVHFDEVKSSHELKIYDKGVAPEEFHTFQGWKDYAEFKAKTRYGALNMPKFAQNEPLELELLDFLESIEKKTKPRSDIVSAVQTVAILTAASKSLAKGGKSIDIKEN